MAARGGRPIIAPLFQYQACDWILPDPLPGAVMLTSAAAARLGGPALRQLTTRPCYAVGTATAAAAAEAGFTHVIPAGPTAAALVARAASAGVTSLLHLAGRDHHATSHPALSLVRRIVYRAEAVPVLPADAATAIAAGPVTALLHSARAARLFATLLHQAQLPRDSITLVAMSSTVAAAAGRGWRALHVAPLPKDEALLALAGLPCEREGDDKDRR